MSEKEVSPDARKSALESDYAALYAVAGLTDALADALKSALAETQQKATRRINELQKRANDLLAQATSTYGDFAVRGKQAVDEVRTTARAHSTKNGKPVIQRNTESERANEASGKGQLEEG